MAMNPMQRKANNYLLMGILGTLVVTGIVIAFLFMQLKKLKDEEAARDAKMKQAYVLAEDVKSGGELDGKVQLMKVDTLVIPENALTKPITENTVAKIDLKIGTVITNDMVRESEDETKSDLRKQEYNMIILPSQIVSGDYIDIRLRLSNGIDYIVISKKQITIPEVNGSPSRTTMSINLTETETMILSNAIIEAYVDKGSLFYVTTYVEPGLQEAVTPTYIPSATVQNAMNANPNIEQEAKNALFARYNQNTSIRENYIDSTLNQYAQERVDSIEAGIQEQISRAQQERERYLDSLGVN